MHQHQQQQQQQRSRNKFSLFSNGKFRNVLLRCKIAFMHWKLNWIELNSLKATMTNNNVQHRTRSVPFLDFPILMLGVRLSMGDVLYDVIIYFNWNCKFVSAQTESGCTWKCAVGAFAWERRKPQKSAAIQNDSGPGGNGTNLPVVCECLCELFLDYVKWYQTPFDRFFKLNTCMLIEIHQWGFILSAFT